MPAHAHHEQVIELKGELTCYDYDENLTVSDLTSWVLRFILCCVSILCDKI